jgi:O-antigen/teichoic acid export membrane protein
VDDAAPAADGIQADLAALARGGAVNLIGLVSNSVLAFLLVIAVTRGLSADRAGVLFEAVAVFSILSSVVEFGADDGVVRAIPRLRAVGRHVDLPDTVAVAVAPVFAAGAAGAVVLFVLAPQLSRLLVHGRGLADDALVPYLRVLAAFLPLSAAMAVVLAATRGLGTMVPTAVIANLGRPALRLVLMVTVMAAGLGSTWIALAWGGPIAGGLIAAVLAGAALLRQAANARRSDHSEPRPRIVLAGEFWRFTAPRGLSSMLGVTVLWLDTLLLGALRTSRQAGIYTAATRYLLLGSFVLVPVQMAMGPVMSRLLALDVRSRARRVYETVTEWVVAPSWPIFLSLAVFAPVFLRVFGAGYREGATALTILALATLAGMATGPCLTVLLMGGKSGWTFAIAAVSMAMNVALNLVLIPRAGMTGAAAAWAVSILFNNLSGLFLVRRLLGLSPVGTGFIVLTLAAAACYGGLGLLVRLTMGASVPSLALFLVLATGSYVAILWRVRGALHLAELRRALSR